MTSNEIRKAFLKFFESKQHQIYPSAPMVIKNDPSLMFTNAGMNQFKDIFLGNSPKKYLRIADTQKCLRVSGKHNDLEEVGHDTYHHTMFEMLGNWSFGDYFKKEAILWAWEFLTEEIKLNKQDLYVTVFGGDEKDNQPKDMEAYEIWSSIIGKDRIIDGSKKDNFWEMGEQGPCGPCSEIHVDLRSENEKKEVEGRDLVNRDHPQVVEIWNLVFIQFNRLANGELQPLPEKHVDTGMGFERLCMAVQKKTSNYDTDIFQNSIQYLANKSNSIYGEDKKKDVAMRVCSDHIRAVAFSIADGQLPSNAKAGYVIRRILRRAIRYGYTFLGFKEPFMYELVDVLVKKMGEQFTELVKYQTLITKVIKEEEISFLKTLTSGIHKFEKYTESNNKQIDGDFAFELYDTYGFPIDLTILMAKEKDFKVDMQGFQANLEVQKQRSRNAANIDTEDWVEIRENQNTVFLGYDLDSCEVEIIRYRKIKQKEKTFYQLIFNQTPFYAELGGQIGDSGYIEGENKERIKIINTKTENGLAVHLVEKLPEDITQSFIANVDIQRRRAIEANHSSTHLLHYALKQVLGNHVEQKGSLVEAERLRFDFSHFSKLSDEELLKVESLVNSLIRENYSNNEMRDMPIEKAKEMGAEALFGEKYSDSVRVIQFGSSIELCGGTHVKALGNIGMFKIVSETAIAAGIRRIEAISGKALEDYLYSLISTIEEAKTLLQQNNLKLGIEKMISENNKLKSEIEEYKNEKIDILFNELKTKVEVIDSINYIELNTNIKPEVVKDLAFRFKDYFKNNNFVFISATNYQDKPNLSIMISQDLVNKGLNAGAIIREASKLIQGNGGGQAFFASAGGKDINGIEKAIFKGKELIFNK